MKSNIGGSLLRLSISVGNSRERWLRICPLSRDGLAKTAKRHDEETKNLPVSSDYPISIRLAVVIEKILPCSPFRLILVAASFVVVASTMARNIALDFTCYFLFLYSHGGRRGEQRWRTLLLLSMVATMMGSKHLESCSGYHGGAFSAFYFCTAMVVVVILLFSVPDGQVQYHL